MTYINSLLDNDLYKFTMQQVVFHNFPRVEVEYDLAVRSDTELGKHVEEVESAINHLSELQMHPDERDYLRTIRFLSKDYIDWLYDFRFRPLEHVTVGTNGNQLTITIKGNWLHTILYEVPILAIIEEVYTSANGTPQLAIANERLRSKIEFVQKHCPDIKFAEFGTRRRYSYFMQDHIISMLSTHLPNNLVGTSNVHFAMKYNLKPTGTMAHELLQAAQALYPLPSHQKDMLYTWAKEFQGDLGYALSDTLGVGYFLHDFTLDLAKLFDGTRQDSGNPYVYGERIINHYKSLGINPKTKYVIFSDNLDLQAAAKLWTRFHDEIGVSFGIGTNFTNDTGLKPVSIVIKMQLCNGIPVVKLSDTPEKAMGRNKQYLEFMKSFVNEAV